MSEDGRLLYANEASNPLLPESGAAIGGPAPAFLQALAREALNKQSATTTDVEASGRTWSLSVSPVVESGDVNIYGRDVTERSRAEEMVRKSEEELSRLNRTLKALSDSNQAMMRARNEADYLDEVCKIIVEDCGHSMAWIGFAEEDEAKTVRPVAQAGFEEGYLETADITWADTERGRGPTGTAIRTGEPAICRNMLTDPSFAPWRKEAVKRGYASSIVLPLTIEGKAFGAINIYSRDPDPFSEKEVRLLSELADDLAYGIAAIRLREEHAEAEEALRDAKQSWERTFDAVPDLIAIIDEHHRIVRANRAMAQRLGVTPDECVGKVCHDAVHGLGCPPGFCPHVRTLADGREHVAEVHEPRLGGDFLVTTTPLADEQGRLIGSVHVARDITERKQAEEALRETRDYLEKLVDYANAPIIVWDPSFTITRFNHAFERLTGRPAGEVVGQRLEVLFPEAERAASMEQIERTLRGEFWELIEIPILHQSGEVRRVLWNSANITAA